MAAITSQLFHGSWGDDALPTTQPGRGDAHIYVDENGQAWLVEAYDPGGQAFTPDKDYHWRATLQNAANVYGEDTRYASISGSSNPMQVVQAIDVWASEWKRKHTTPAAAPAEGGGAVILLLVIAYLAFNEKKGR